MESEVVKVVYAVPESPKSRIRYSLLPDSRTNLATPTRKRRQHKINSSPSQTKRVAHPCKSLSSAPTSALNGESVHHEFSSEVHDEPSGIDFDLVNTEESGNKYSKLVEDRKFTFFVEAVCSDQCAFLQLTEDIFVANDWNMSKDEATYQWIHIQSVRHGEHYKTGCQCARAKRTLNCFHIRYLSEYQVSRFSTTYDFTNVQSRTFLCARYESARDGIYDTVFSVPPPPATFATTIKQRAIVEHHGDDKGEGTWKCSKEPTAISCYHIVQARHSLRQHIRCDASAVDEEAGMGELEYAQEPIPLKKPVAMNESVSTLLIPPPVWARISTDPVFPALPVFDTSNAPARICLDDNSTCCCKTPREAYNPFQPSVTKECTIYGLTGATKTTIEVQSCPACIQRDIGPDCRSLGLFNWNNRTLLTHELLDDYTNQYTTSETPFIAWVTVTSRRYEARSTSTIPFMNHRLFRAAWFSYIRLVQLNNDMHCSACGPNPEAVIVDGVTLAFHRKNLLATLEPPTTISPASIRKDLIRNIPNLQFFINPSLRSKIRAVLNGSTLLVALLPDLEGIDTNSGACLSDSDSSSSETDQAAYSELETRRQNQAKMKKYKAMETRIKLVPSIIAELSNLDPALSNLFDRCYGPAAFMSNYKAPTEYKTLFLQVAAEETVLQFINGEALEILRNFCAATQSVDVLNIQKNSVNELASQLIAIPALYHVVRHELSQSVCIHADTLGVCRWLYIRGATVLKTLIKYPAPGIEIEVPSGGSTEKWQETGACYAMPKIRHRPIYPNMKYENGKNSGTKDERGAGCNKFFSRYGQSRLTGGIMCIWCSHSVCYGFHCIPSAEGRNDVFSAIYTRWKTAPKIIVYDFACALLPYCMTREPAFFANTLFAIDVFHATGHTKCGHAAFLNTYCSTNPELLYINSSAAECGNGGILRIRKSVAYMSQERAIVYTKTFLAIWNRQRIRVMEANK